MKKNKIAYYKTHPSEYRSYQQAKQRTLNPNNNSYKYYGASGIKFLFNSFEEFLLEIGEKPEPKNKYSIERIDNSKNYEIGNVKWDLMHNQSRNKRNNRLITINRETKCLIDWCKQFNLTKQTISYRINNLNWCDYCAVTITVHGNGKRFNCEHNF